METLQSSLQYEPHELKFGTSGRRGLVAEMTQLEVYLCARAEIEYLKSIPRSEGGIVTGDEFYYASDLRPSSTAFVPELGGRGELAQAIEQAISDAGMRPVNLGLIPTPALTSYAIGHQRGSMMITGSHIPFDRNGYKTNTAQGELLKKHEAPIGRMVAEIRSKMYAQPFCESPFGADGLFKNGHRALLPVDQSAYKAYVARYCEFFSDDSLQGMRLMVYQHSAVGRDLLPEILRALGAEVVLAGRSSTFVPIDTENIGAAQLDELGQMVREHMQQFGKIDAVVSTDGDSDRPLVLGVDADGSVQFFSGDRLGMVVAEFLGADAVVVPISCNDAIDRGSLAPMLEPKTRIGSPYVIAGMQMALGKGHRRVCGWEANGGFLTGSAIERKAHLLSALPTRDALLPILCVLLRAREKGISLHQLFALLPNRQSRSALLKKFPRSTALKIVDSFSPISSKVAEVVFDGDRPRAFVGNGLPMAIEEEEQKRLEKIRTRLEAVFTAAHGFDAIAKLNYIDGVRIYFRNGEVAHIRPSGNADELRIYAVADSLERAEAIAALGISEPDGLLRTLENAVTN